MDKFYEAISHFRRKNYEKCVELCNEILQTELGNLHNVGRLRDKLKKDLNIKENISQQMIEGVWQLKMRSLTQRVFVDDLETEDNDEEYEELEYERIATAARPGTSIKTAFTSRPNTSRRLMTSTSTKTARPGTLTSRPVTGMIRPGTSFSRPGTSVLNSRPQTRCGTSRQVRLTSAAAYSMNDPTSSLFQASRLNPTIYAEKAAVVKPLFQFLFYHENDPAKALMLCEAVSDINKNKTNWWWDQQRGRCLVTLNHSRKAEDFLLRSLANFSHPDTYLLLCKLYMKLNQPQKALQLLSSGIEKNPSSICLKIHQARIYELMANTTESIRIYKMIAQLNPINTEALSCIAVQLFYDNQPEMALMYYRRISAMGVHSPELYCNIGLCCLYGGALDLVLPCFQRAIHFAITPEQRADIWYNLSFVGITIGDYNLAKRCLKLSLASDASNGAALNNLGVLLTLNGDISRANSYFMSAKNTLIDCPELENNLKIIEGY